MKIVVPVDFHPTSLAAYKYAINFHDEAHDEITLLHVINGSFNSNKALSYEPLKEMEGEMKRRLEVFAESVGEPMIIDHKRLDMVVRFGIPGFTIADYVEDKGIDLVVMGTRDKHGMFDRIMGSCSSILIRAASCPVILIHPNITFSTIKKIAFAFDDPEDISDSLIKFQRFNSKVNAHVTFIHMLDQKELKSTDASITGSKASEIDRILEGTDYEIEILDYGKLKVRIEEYCHENKIDLLAMTHRKEGVFKGLFTGFDSVKVAQHIQLPVLVFHE